MAPPSALIVFLLVLFLFAQSHGADGAKIKIVNNSKYKLWPTILSTSEPTTAFALKTGQSSAVMVPPGFSGKIWARTFCAQGPTAPEKLSCATGDCGASSTTECAPGVDLNISPATVVEMTLPNTADEPDSYRVTLRHGYNLAVKVEPEHRGGSECTSVICTVDLATACPAELKVTAAAAAAGVEVIGCKNGCKAFGWTQPVCWSNSSVLMNSTCSNGFLDKTFNCSSSSTNYKIIFESRSSVMESGPTAGDDDSTDQELFIMKIIKWVAGAIVLLLGGGFTIKCYISYNRRSVN